MAQRNSTYVEPGESFDRDMDYIPDRITRGAPNGRSSRAATG